ncbi:LAFE_0E06700g1_1 [Lachancea fermentati]|uniref:LAFE_0E06700g1_1 n=1 Tax=Lachancea fermentati TaxID=4955 RepID=A0A1G4MD15_LACFM|nr:LAFE_0E06700g1_1 [Lachancea fermentati]
MPIQLFGRDQIVVHYGRNGEQSNHDQVLDSDETEIGRVRERLKLLLARCRDRIRETKYLKLTLVHWTLLAMWILLLINLTTVYNSMYARSALLTTMCTNALLFGISDILAQCIVCYTSSQINPVPSFVDSATKTLGQRLGAFTGSHSYEVASSDDDISIFNDYGPSNYDHSSSFPHPSNEVSVEPLGEEDSQSNAHSDSFDYFRWSCFMAWGSFLSFFQVPWYRFLNYFYTEDPTVVQVLERVLSDQLLYSPISLYCFFMYSNYIMEGGDSFSFQRKLQKVYLGTLGCNYLLWPPVQFINFLTMPRHFQVPFSSSVGVLWNCFLSMRNASNSS